MALVDLDAMKTRLGITTDAAGDQFIQQWIDTIDARVKIYTGRPLEQQEFTDMWYDAELVWLREVPVVTPIAVLADGAVLVEGTDYLLDANTGQLHRIVGSRIVDDWTIYTNVGAVYTAGYDPAAATGDPFAVPADILGLFDRVIGSQWSQREGAGDSTTGAYASARVKKDVAQDVGSVEYFAPESAAGYSIDFIAGFPLDVLDLHKRHRQWLPDAASSRVVS